MPGRPATGGAARGPPVKRAGRRPARRRRPPARARAPEPTTAVAGSCGPRRRAGADARIARWPATRRRGATTACTTGAQRPCSRSTRSRSTPTSCAFLIVRGLLAGWGCRCREILDADGARGVVLQEDLGDLTLQDVARRRERRRSGASSTARRSTSSCACSARRRRAASARPASRSPSTSRSSPGSCTSSRSTSWRAPRRATSRSRTARRSRRASTGWPPRSRPGRACSATATSTAAT